MQKIRQYTYKITCILAPNTPRELQLVSNDCYDNVLEPCNI